MLASWSELFKGEGGKHSEKWKISRFQLQMPEQRVEFVVWDFGSMSTSTTAVVLLMPLFQ